MKNKILISTIAITLAFSFYMPAYALDLNCNKLNKDGQFDNEDCTVINSLEKINDGEKFIKLNNVGRRSEYNLLFLIVAKLMGFYQT